MLAILVNLPVTAPTPEWRVGWRETEEDPEIKRNSYQKIPRLAVVGGWFNSEGVGKPLGDLSKRGSLT